MDYIETNRLKKYGRTVQKGPFLLTKDEKTLLWCFSNVSRKCVIPSSVTKIDVSAFHECTHITELVIPEGVTELEPCTFNNLYSLHTLHIPNSMQHIGYYCFKHCEHLYYVTMPSHMIVGIDAFPNRLIVLRNFLKDKEAGLLAKLTGKI